ncbi:MAG: hypothetical protein R2708_27650 [Vicinamibacterales bacterium]
MSAMPPLETFPILPWARLRDCHRVPRVHVDARKPACRISAPLPSASAAGRRLSRIEGASHYLLAFRNQGIFYEAATNQILTIWWRPAARGG